MSVVQNMAIKHKLIMIIMTTCIAALFLASVILLLFERGEYREETVDSISCYAEMIGDNCRAALAFEDAEDAKEHYRTMFKVIEEMEIRGVARILPSVGIR